MIHIGTASYDQEIQPRNVEIPECPDCGHRITAHLSSGCAVTDRDGEPLPCLCRLSPDDIGITIDNEQENTK